MWPDQGWLAAALPNRPRIESFIALIEAYALSTAAAGAPRVLEVGSAWGYSTILMAQAGSCVTAVDPHQDFGSRGRFFENVRRYGMLHRVKPVYEFSQNYLPSLADASFDLAFIDGDHGEPAASFDCQQALRLVRPGGLIAVHDYSPRWPGVISAVRRELRGLPHWQIQTLYLAAL